MLDNINDIQAFVELKALRQRYAAVRTSILQSNPDTLAMFHSMLEAGDEDVVLELLNTQLPETLFALLGDLVTLVQQGRYATEATSLIKRLPREELLSKIEPLLTAGLSMADAPHSGFSDGDVAISNRNLVELAEKLDHALFERVRTID